MCIALVIGNMIGSGIFLLPASLAPYGGMSLVGWGISTLGALMLAWVFAQLSRLVRRAGGPYAYARYGFGDFAGFLVAWGYWISILATNAAISVAMVSYLTVFWPALAREPVLASGIALSCIWGLTWINAGGVHQGGRLQVVTTVLKLLPLLALATIGLFYIEMEHFVPFNPSGEPVGSAIKATVALTLWAFLGFESATIPAEHVDRPEITIPRATLVGTVVTAVVYLLGTFAVLGILPRPDLAVSTAPFADAAAQAWGDWARYAVGIGAIVSCLGALNGWILIQGQIPWAAARDGLFPAVFGRMSGKDVPIVGILISSVLVTLLMMLNYTRGLVELFTFTILLATLTALVPYLFAAMTELLYLLRYRERFSRGRFVGAVLLSAGAFLYSMWAIAGAGPETVYWGFLLLMSGLPVYIWIRRATWKDQIDR